VRGGVARGAAIIAVGGFIVKVIGAVYRVPLTNLIGAEGIGLYQMVFPLYCAMLTVSSTGIPTALSRLISKSPEKADGYLSRSLFLFGTIGAVGSVIMFVLGGFFARLQGDSAAAWCYRAISPSVFLVSVISCYRGYFQGKSNMVPTAISQIAEQAVKAAVGLLLCYFFRGSVALSAALAAVAVTLSEAGACVYLAFKARGVDRSVAGALPGNKEILLTVVPVALTAIMLPLGSLADSFIVINKLSDYTPDATALYGIYSGVVAAIVGVPVSVAYGVAVASVPALSGGDDVKIADCMRFTGFIAIPCWLLLTFFAGAAVRLLYGGLAPELLTAAERVLAVDAVSVVLLSFLQTTNAVLVAKGKLTVPVLSMGASLIFRAVLCAVLSSFPGLGILGAAIAANASYALALTVNCLFALRGEKVSDLLLDLSKYFFISITCVLGGFLVYCRFKSAFCFIVVSMLIALVYVAASLLFGEGKLRETILHAIKNKTKKRRA